MTVYICGKCNRRMITTAMDRSNIHAIYTCPKCEHFIVQKTVKDKKNG